LRLGYILESWNERAHARGLVFDSSTGFTVPDGSIHSPDGSRIASERWRAIPPERRIGYVGIVRDVCIEIVSPSQTFDETVRKALRYRDYGAGCAVVLDPQQRRVRTDGIAPAGFPTNFSRVICDDAENEA